MAAKKISRFPSQVINDSLGNVQITLLSAKSSLHHLMYDDALKAAIEKCIETFQELISYTFRASSDWRDETEKKTRRARELRQNKRTKKLTEAEEKELNKLEQEDY